MNKSDLIDAIAKRTGASRTGARAARALAPRGARVPKFRPGKALRDAIN